MTAGTPAITIVGLGTGSAPVPAAIGDAGQGALLFLRQSRHPSVAHLGSASWIAFDGLFDGTAAFGDVADAIAQEIIGAALEQPVIYAVPGNPLTDDSTVRLIRARASDIGVTVEVIPAQSLADAALASVPAAQAGPGLQIVDALDIAAVADADPFAGGRLPVSPLRPVVITGLDSRALATEVARTLRRAYPAQTPVQLVGRPADEPTGARKIDLSDLGTGPLPDLAVAYVPAIDPLTGGHSSDALQQVVALLRAPDGCPWDREQTHRSLRQAAIEEAYEVVAAIDGGDPAELCEELGDLLLQAYLHAQIAEEAGDFTLEDVFGAITAKLVRRHPHVFGDVVADNAAAVVSTWDEIKRRERAERGITEESHPLGKIPATLPALMRAQTVARRARRAGLVSETSDDIRMPLMRLADAPAAIQPDAIGDALWAIATLASDAGVDAEELLRERTYHFEELARHRAAQDENAGRKPAEGETAG